MPPRPLKVCRHAGCHELTRDPSGYCPKHKEAAEARARKWKAEQDSQRESAYRRGYGARWRKLRAQILMDEPLCRECRKAGRIVPATDVDHIVARADGGTDDRSNLQPLCHACHSRKTVRENGGRAVTRRGGDQMFGATIRRPHRAGGFLFVQNGGRGSTGIWRDVNRCRHI